MTSEFGQKLAAFRSKHFKQKHLLHGTNKFTFQFIIANILQLHSTETFVPVIHFITLCSCCFISGVIHEFPDFFIFYLFFIQ